MKYFSAIFIHGLILPGTVLLLFLGGTLFGWSKFQAEVERRNQIYQTLKSNEAQATELTAKVRPYLDRLQFWRGITTGDQFEQIDELLRSAESESNKKQKLVREKFRKDPAAAPFSPEIKAVTEQYGIGFRGRFGVLQSAALSLEMRKPNMILTGFSLRAPASEKEHALLQAEYTYLAFTAEQPATPQ